MAEYQVSSKVLGPRTTFILNFVIRTDNWSNQESSLLRLNQSVFRLKVYSIHLCVIADTCCPPYIQSSKLRL